MVGHVTHRRHWMRFLIRVGYVRDFTVAASAATATVAVAVAAVVVLWDRSLLGSFTTVPISLHCYELVSFSLHWILLVSPLLPVLFLFQRPDKKHWVIWTRYLLKYTWQQTCELLSNVTNRSIATTASISVLHHMNSMMVSVPYWN